MHWLSHTKPRSIVYGPVLFNRNMMLTVKVLAMNNTGRYYFVAPVTGIWPFQRDFFRQRL